MELKTHGAESMGLCKLNVYHENHLRFVKGAKPELGTVITLHAVSKPKLVGTSLHFKSPSMVFGHPMTRVFNFLPLKILKK